MFYKRCVNLTLHCRARRNLASFPTDSPMPPAVVSKAKVGSECAGLPTQGFCVALLDAMATETWPLIQDQPNIHETCTTVARNMTVRYKKTNSQTGAGKVATLG